MADQCATHGAHEEAHGEDAEGRQQLGHRVFVWKEGAPNRGGEITVNCEVEPLQHIADCAYDDGPTHAA